MDTEDETGESKGGQRVVYEGPILISTTEVKGEFVIGQLRHKIIEAIAKGHLTNEESTRGAIQLHQSTPFPIPSCIKIFGLNVN